ncbi:MAG TPA: FG-GAP-like repeat-containing protein [Candidatus Dormibacteraeota bacterium]|jgi:DNA-binding CsgD family transcriptional regulator|nr:FG-GAP-like repeat-containing protein [Candidatus Dormibacteraeota bacterium]
MDAHPAEPAPYPLTAADFNGDGILDLAVADYLADRIVIVLGRPGDVWELKECHPVVRPVAVEAADLDGDGSIDLLVASQGSGGLQVMYGSGRGTFEPGPHLECPPPRSISICDVNGDGQPEVVVSQARGVTVFTSRGRRGFTVRTLPTAGVGRMIDGLHPTPAGESRIWVLTGRERQVARLACLGYSAGEIGRLLGIGRRTVETYLAGALSKLGLESKRQLERHAPWGREHT